MTPAVLVQGDGHNYFQTWNGIATTLCANAVHNIGDLESIRAATHLSGLRARQFQVMSSNGAKLTSGTLAGLDGAGVSNLLVAQIAGAGGRWRGRVKISAGRQRTGQRGSVKDAA